MFNDANDFFNTMAEGGNAMRFEDVDGIGPKTAQKIQSVRGVQNPDDVAAMSADELSDKAGISHSRATKAIKAGGGNPNRSKRDTTGSVSAAGITYPVGDFRVEAGDQDKARARNDTFTRSEEAIRQDEQKRAPITTDVEKWKDNKSKFDFPGVDTPTQDPNALPKDYKAGDPRTTEVDEEQEVATDTGNNLPFMREIGGESMLAGDVANEGPEGAIPGLAPDDFTRSFLSHGEHKGEDKGIAAADQEPPERKKSTNPRAESIYAEEAPTSVLAIQGQTNTENTQPSSGGTLDTALGNTTQSNQGTIDGKPPFREPKINLYNTGDEFHFTYESDRAGAGMVSHSGTVTKVDDDKIQVDVGNSNYYEIFSTGRVVSISDNWNRTMVGYTVVE